MLLSHGLTSWRLSRFIFREVISCVRVKKKKKKRLVMIWMISLMQSFQYVHVLMEHIKTFNSWSNIKHKCCQNVYWYTSIRKLWCGLSDLIQSAFKETVGSNYSLPKAVVRGYLALLAIILVVCRDNGLACYSYFLTTAHNQPHYLLLMTCNVDVPK